MPTLGNKVRRSASQKQRQLISAISSQNGIEQAAKEYMEALAILRAELFSVVVFPDQMKRNGLSSKALHDGAGHIADLAA